MRSSSEEHLFNFSIPFAKKNNFFVTTISWNPATEPLFHVTVILCAQTSHGI